MPKFRILRGTHTVGSKHRGRKDHKKYGPGDIIELPDKDAAKKEPQRYQRVHEAEEAAGDTLDDMTVIELKQLASDEEIEVGGLNKADIVQEIRLAKINA